MESEKVKVIKEYLRCMRGEKACWDCGLNEIAENQDTCCINLVADMTLDLINELEKEKKELLEELADAFPKEKGISSSHVKIHRFIDELKNKLGLE